MALAACSPAPRPITFAIHDNLMSCFKPDNSTSYTVKVGTPCKLGDHYAYECYLPDGRAVGVLRGSNGPNAECRARGGSLLPLRYGNGEVVK